MNQILYSKRNEDAAKRIALVFCILFVLLVIASVSFGIANKANDKILKGVSIEGIDVGDMTKEQATIKLNEELNRLKNNEIVLKFDGAEKTIKGEDLGITFDTRLVDMAYNYGRTGNLLSDNYTVLFSYFNRKFDVNIGLTLEETKYETIIASLKEGKEEVEKDDTYEISEDKITIVKGNKGIDIKSDELKGILLDTIKNNNKEINVPTEERMPTRVDFEKLYEDVYVEAVDAKYTEGENFDVTPEVVGVNFDKVKAKEEYDNVADGETITIDLVKENPKVTISSLNDVLFKDLLATFQTKYDTSYTARVTNLKLAAGKINGTILYPNQEFSYNKIVGERTAANGFKEAHVFAGGEVVDGLGGGICQVSTTLYNTVLMLDLDVTERKSHMMHTGYTKPGLDATVVYGAIDFRFVNNRKTPLKIEMTVDKGIVKANVYGLKSSDDPIIEVVSKTLKTIPYTTEERQDSTMYVGTTRVIQSPLNGYESETYKVFKDADGKEISRELVSKDTYKQTKKIIAVGTKLVEVVEPVTPPVAPVEPVTPPTEPTTPETPTQPTNPGIILPPGWDNPESPYGN